MASFGDSKTFKQCLSCQNRIDPCKEILTHTHTSHTSLCVYSVYIYNIKWKFKVATVVSLTVAAVAVRSFCTVGQKLQAQGLLIHNVGVRSVVFNTASQFVDPMVSTLDTYTKKNAVETLYIPMAYCWSSWSRCCSLISISVVLGCWTQGCFSFTLGC